MVEKSGFKKTIDVFDLKYEVPSRKDTGIPALCATTHERVSKEMLAVDYFYIIS